MPPRAHPFSLRVAAITLAACSLVGLAAGCSDKKSDVTASGTTDTTAKNGDKTTTPKVVGCPQGQWPNNMVGEPKDLKKADQVGVFVWTDFAGMHVRVRDTSDKPPHLAGSVTGSKDITSIKAVPDGLQALDLKGNRITFDFAAGKDLKGFDLNVGCAVTQLQFDLQNGLGPWPADQIRTGSSSKATGSTFTITRA